MAYHFNGTSASMEFALGAFSGYTGGPITMASLWKNTSGYTGNQWVQGFSDSTLNDFRLTQTSRVGNPALHTIPTNCNSSQPLDTTSWWIMVVTRGSGTVTPRFHVYDSTSGTWSHQDGNTTVADATMLSSDRLTVGGLGTFACFFCDLVCVGIKKADRTDLQVQALNLTQFLSWFNFGFDWLIGFETSSTQQNRITPGTGDEVTRSSVTTGASDPPAWSWTLAPTTNIKTVGGLSYASVKTVQGLAKASVKKIQGVA